MSLGGAENGLETIPRKAGDAAIVLGYRLGEALNGTINDIARILRIEVGGDLG